MRELIRTEWRLLLFGFLMTFWSSPGQAFFISLFSGAVRDDFGLSHAEFGAIFSLATLASAAIIIWTGPLVDRIALRLFSCCIIGGLAVSVLALSISHTLVALTLAIFLLRQFGQSLMMLTGLTTMVRYLERDKGKATALGGMGYAFSEAIMPTLMIALVAAIGWRASLQSTGLFLIFAVLPLAWLLLRNHDQRHRDYLAKLEGLPPTTPATVSHDAPEQGPGDDARSVKTADKPSAGNQPSVDPSWTLSASQRQRQWTRREVVRDKRFYLFMPALLAQSMLFTGFIFHQIHLIEVKGWSLSLWGSFFLVYAVVSIITKLITGFAVDKIGSIRIVPYAAIPTGVGLLLLGLSSHISIALIFLILLGITTGVQYTISTPFWSDMYGSAHLGSIKSLSSATMASGSALTPFLMGWFIDAGTHIDTLALAGALYVAIAVGMAYWAYRLTPQAKIAP